MARIAFLIMLVLPGVTQPAAKRDAQAIAHSLEARYQRTHTLKAIFFERYTDGKGATTAESGTVYFSRPGRMRWDYESPEQKLFIVDGANVWFYVPADRTASRAKMKDSSDWRTPLALLTGKADLSKLCRSLQLADASAEKGGKLGGEPVPPGDALLLCIPADSAPGDQRKVLFEVDADSNLVRVSVDEPGRLETEFRFGNWEQNISIPEDRFHFQPPPGVTIVDEQSLAGEIR